MTEDQAESDQIGPHHHVIEVRVSSLMQLFNAIDPSPFHEKDLDPNAEEFIVGWALDLPREAELALRVHLAGPPQDGRQATMLHAAIRESFRRRAESSRRRLREMFRVGRISLLIGVVFLGASLVAGDLVEDALSGKRIGSLLREGLLIGGWVAMWRPLEIFLYNWWPIRREARLYDRLAAMPVRIVPVAPS